MNEIITLWESTFFMSDLRPLKMLLFFSAVFSFFIALGIVLYYALDNFKEFSLAVVPIGLICLIAFGSFMGFRHIPNYYETGKINNLILKHGFESKLKEDQINLLNNAIFNYLKAEKRLTDDELSSQELIQSNKITWDYETVKDFFDNVK